MCEPTLTDWYPAEIKPVRTGWWETQWFDCGWAYEWRIWFDGQLWRDGPNGWALSDQNVTWRGLNADHG